VNNPNLTVTKGPPKPCLAKARHREKEYFRARVAPAVMAFFQVRGFFRAKVDLGAMECFPVRAVHAVMAFCRRPAKSPMAKAYFSGTRMSVEVRDRTPQHRPEAWHQSRASSN